MRSGYDFVCGVGEEYVYKAAHKCKLGGKAFSELYADAACALSTALLAPPAHDTKEANLRPEFDPLMLEGSTSFIMKVLVAAPAPLPCFLPSLSHRPRLRSRPSFFRRNASSNRQQGPTHRRGILLFLLFL